MEAKSLVCSTLRKSGWRSLRFGTPVKEDKLHKALLEVDQPYLIPPPAGLTENSIDAVAMHGIVTQTGNTLVKLAPMKEYEALLNTYVDACGADMSKGATPTQAQVSCYLALAREGGSIAVDFAV